MPQADTVQFALTYARRRKKPLKTIFYLISSAVISQSNPYQKLKRILTFILINQPNPTKHIQLQIEGLETVARTHKKQYISKTKFIFSSRTKFH